MINLITIVQIVGLFLIAMYQITKNEVLEKENNRLKERIKSDRKWAEDYRYLSIESAIASERLRVSHEEFKKTCEEFQERVNEVK